MQSLGVPVLCGQVLTPAFTVPCEPVCAVPVLSGQVRTPAFTVPCEPVCAVPVLCGQVLTPAFTVPCEPVCAVCSGCPFQCSIAVFVSRLGHNMRRTSPTEFSGRQRVS